MPCAIWCAVRSRGGCCPTICHRRLLGALEFDERRRRQVVGERIRRSQLSGSPRRSEGERRIPQAEERGRAQALRVRFGGETRTPSDCSGAGAGSDDCPIDRKSVV